MKRERAASLTLCKDIGEITVSSNSKRIQKKGSESGTAPFTRWIGEQADGYCEDGLCSSGTCDGHVKNQSASVINETNEYVDVRFSADLFCECG